MWKEYGRLEYSVSGSRGRVVMEWNSSSSKSDSIGNGKANWSLYKGDIGQNRQKGQWSEVEQLRGISTKPVEFRL